MNYQALKTELADDPLGRYTGMTTAEVAASGHIKNRTIPKTSLSGDELFAATDATDWGSLTAEKRQLWVSWCSTARDPWGTANVAFVKYIFGNTSTTVINLTSLRVNPASRWEELELGNVKAGHIEQARAM